MVALISILLGVLAGVGFVLAAFGLQERPVRDTQTRLADFRTRAASVDLSKSTGDVAAMVGLGVVLGVGVWLATGWVVAAMLGATAGVVGPIMWRAPRNRRDFIEEIEAYSQWTEQVRDLVAASGSLFEAVTLSASQAPPRLRPHVVQMASVARTLGLTPALDWFAARMESPFADRLVLGMKIAWDSGARVSEAFDGTARAMRAEVETRRRNEVANARAWTQVLAILGVTVGAVVLMFVFNRGFFDPFGTVFGQVVLLIVGILIFGNVFWVLKLSESGMPVRLLTSDKNAVADSVAAAAGPQE